MKSRTWLLPEINTLSGAVDASSVTSFVTIRVSVRTRLVQSVSITVVGTFDASAASTSSYCAQSLVRRTVTAKDRLLRKEVFASVTITVFE